MKTQGQNKKQKWIIVAIIIGALTIVGAGIVVAYNNGLLGDDEDCMCAAPPGVKQCRNCDPGVVYKPVIYLYPEDSIDITVKLGYPELITTNYPSYGSGWKVFAEPNGNLNMNNRNYYSLYYESQNKINFKKTDVGFVVNSDDAASFLEEKLAILGLNERESEEFIIYWLPKLQAQDYVYIRFATEQEISENMPLEITPKPDTTIRVLMLWKKIDKLETVTEQKLVPVDRNGYTAVEWGGSEIE